MNKDKFEKMGVLCDISRYEKEINDLTNTYPSTWTIEEISEHLKHKRAELMAELLSS